MFACKRALLAGATSLVIAASAIPIASAQIVPETSGQTSAANSPAAIVQTGYRRRIECTGCDAPSDSGLSRTPSSRDVILGERGIRLR